VPNTIDLLDQAHYQFCVLNRLSHMLQFTPTVLLTWCYVKRKEVPAEHHFHFPSLKSSCEYQGG
jgi:hypothetical protein